MMSSSQAGIPRRSATVDPPRRAAPCVPAYSRARVGLGGAGDHRIVAARMPRVSKIIVTLYILFNLAIALTLLVDPAQLDATYRGGPMTPTREFLWFSIASFHLFAVAVASASLRMARAAERRWIVLANAGFYLWDAVTQWLYWGGHVGLARADLHINAGVSAGCAALMAFAAWLDRGR